MYHPRLFPSNVIIDWSGLLCLNGLGTMVLQASNSGATELNSANSRHWLQFALCYKMAAVQAETIRHELPMKGLCQVASEMLAELLSIDFW